MDSLDVDVWWGDLRSADLRSASTLPARELARLEQVADQTQRGRRLVGALLIQHALRRLRGLPETSTVDIDRTCADCGAQHGRPVVADGLGPHLSVAHSGLVVVVATCRAAAVGVDVEKTDRADADQWVRREARLKAGIPDGTGTVVPMSVELDGYVAALAVARSAALTVREHQLDHPL